MNAFTSRLSRTKTASLCLTPTFMIMDAEGNTAELLGRPASELVRCTLDQVVDQQTSLAIIQAMAAHRRGAGREESFVDVPHTNLCVFASPVSGHEAGIVRVSIQQTAGSIAWTDDADESGTTAQQHDRDGFLDLATSAMHAGHQSAVTLVHVFGGLSPDADNEMRRIVHQEAVSRGASATSRLENGTYGILHPARAASENIFAAISESAVAKGVVTGAEALGAEEIDNDNDTIDPQVIRATLTDSSRTLASRIASGFRRLGLGRRVDETKRRVAGLMVDVRKAIEQQSFHVEARPILSLRKSSVAIHEVRAHPMLNGFPVDTSVIEALGEDQRFARDMQLASVEAGLRHHHDLLTWKGVSLRVMVSIMADMLMDRKVVSRINDRLHSSGVSSRKLILRACQDHAAGVPGQGESYLDAAAAQEWRIAVPDFYAFVKAGHTGSQPVEDAAPEEAKAYIEVDVDRLQGLSEQPDGKYLLHGLIGTWRGRQTEIVATSINSRRQLDFLKDTGVRYAKGARVGDWKSTA